MSTNSIDSLLHEDRHFPPNADFAANSVAPASLYADAKAAGAPDAVASAITTRAEALTQEEPLPAAPPPAADPEADQRWLDGQAA